MYNKLFTKILDSSIWLEPTATRIVWLTFLAVMDERGFVTFACNGNVANRARVTLEEADEAIRTLESPDEQSSDPDHDGRRIERVPGGWMVLNAEKHRKLVTRAIIQEQTRLRVQKHREKKRKRNAAETPSRSRSGSEEEREKKAPDGASLSPVRKKPKAPDAFTDAGITERAGRFVERYQELYREYRHGARYAVKPVRDYAAAVTLCQTWPDDRLEKLAKIFLMTDHSFAEEGSRTLNQFLALASWCDGRLAEHEQTKTRQG